MYQISVWLHILMAAIWVGGLIYTAAVVVPYAISQGGEDRQRILRGLARRFRWIGWGSLGVLFVTGLANLLLRLSPVPLTDLFNGAAFDPARTDRFIAVWLPWKLLLVVTMIALMLYHDVTSMRAARQHQGDPSSAPGNRGGSRAAALATLIAIAIVYVSVRMVRG
ncbi:MAG TPA: CopD family protein [Blastocatellia bacterium]|nr:CopD family protein [Blastocatellia bacterium]